MVFWEGKSQERIIFLKTRTIMIETGDELLEIFLKLSMKTVHVHLIIGATLD